MAILQRAETSGNRAESIENRAQIQYRAENSGNCAKIFVPNTKGELQNKLYEKINVRNSFFSRLHS